MPSEIVMQCSKALSERQLTIAFVESATAGRLTAEFSMCPESGSTLKGGLICYDAALKESILHVPKDMLRRFTPESAEVTRELAERLQIFMPADLHIAVTGLTCPGGSETPEKPVGTMFVQLCTREKSVGIREVFAGRPEEIVLRCINRIASLILAEIPVVSEQR